MSIFSEIGNAVGDVFNGVENVGKDVLNFAGPVLPGIAAMVGAPYLAPELAGLLGISPSAASSLAGILAGGGMGALEGQNPLLGAAMGGLGGYFAAPTGDASMLAGSSDPMAALSKAMQVTGTNSASEAASALGFGSPEAMLASVNPSWVSTGSGMLTGFTNAATRFAPGMMGVSAPGAGSSFFGPGPVGGGVMAMGALGMGGQALGGLSPLQTLLGLGSSYLGYQQAQNLMAAARRADPMSEYRGGYAKDLYNLQQDPSSITKAPGYEAGLEAVERSMASQGYLGSGNMMAALQKYGGDFYQQQFNNLSSLAGVNISPAVALQGRQAASGMTGDVMNRLGYLAATSGV